MDEKEALGKVAYEALLLSYNGAIPASDDIQAWDKQTDRWKQAWSDVAEAVTNRVLELQRIAVEASE